MVGAQVSGGGGLSRSEGQGGGSGEGGAESSIRAKYGGAKGNVDSRDSDASAPWGKQVEGHGGGGVQVCRSSAAPETCASTSKRATSSAPPHRAGIQGEQHVDATAGMPAAASGAVEDVGGRGGGDVTNEPGLGGRGMKSQEAPPNAWQRASDIRAGPNSGAPGAASIEVAAGAPSIGVPNAGAASTHTSAASMHVRNENENENENMHTRNENDAASLHTRKENEPPRPCERGAGGGVTGEECCEQPTPAPSRGAHADADADAHNVAAADAGPHNIAPTSPAPTLAQLLTQATAPEGGGGGGSAACGGSAESGRESGVGGEDVEGGGRVAVTAVTAVTAMRRMGAAYVNQASCSEVEMHALAPSASLDVGGDGGGCHALGGGGGGGPRSSSQQLLGDGGERGRRCTTPEMPLRSSTPPMPRADVWDKREGGEGGGGVTVTGEERCSSSAISVISAVSAVSATSALSAVSTGSDASKAAKDTAGGGWGGGVPANCAALQMNPPESRGAKSAYCGEERQELQLPLQQQKKRSRDASAFEEAFETPRISQLTCKTCGREVHSFNFPLF